MRLNLRFTCSSRQVRIKGFVDYGTCFCLNSTFLQCFLRVSGRGFRLSGNLNVPKWFFSLRMQLQRVSSHLRTIAKTALCVISCCGNTLRAKGTESLIPHFPDFPTDQPETFNVVSGGFPLRVQLREQASSAFGTGAALGSLFGPGFVSSGLRVDSM